MNKEPDHDSLEKDAVWDLVKQASSRPAPSPSFVQDTLRKARLDSAQKERSPWQRFFAPAALISATATAAIAIGFYFSSPVSSPVETEELTVSLPAETTENKESWDELENALATEILAEVARDPSLVSDSELLALLY